MQNSSNFFENRGCQFFPCHALEGDFNCLFCYCPFYQKNPCPGNPTFIKKDDGRILKRCTDCTFPHKPENYERIMRLLRTKKSEIDFTEEFHHGGEISSKSAKILDFSVNTNPLGLPENVKIAIKNSIDDYEKYPDQNCTELRKKLISTRPNLAESEIIFGNGASELISLCVQAISPKKTLLLSPTFSGYERALKICDSEIFYHNLKKENNFILDEEFFSSLERFS